MRRRAAGVSVVAALVAASLGGLGGGSGAAMTPRALRAALPYDVTGDGHPDIVIGAPTLQVGEVRGAGGVVVIPSTGSGLQPSGWFVDESDLAAGGYAQTADRFGATVASGDFDRDGYADLAVGAPGDNDGGWSAGAVIVVYGSASGPRGDRSTLLQQAGGAVAGARFGSAMVSADFDGDGYADLAVGAPGVHGAPGGIVDVFHGSASGLRSPAAVLGAPSAESGFGAVLAAGDIDGRKGADLVVGAPGVLATTGMPGIPGSVSWCAGGAVTAWCQPLVTGEQYAGLTALTLARVMSSASQGVDVVVGVPTAASRAGAVQLVGTSRGADGSVGVRRTVTITQDSAGVRGSNEAGDAFGTAVTAARLDGDAFADLVIGAPGEDAERGRVTIVRGATDGWRTTGSRSLDQSTRGVPGVSERYDRFGASLTFVDANGDTEPDLLVGVPGENGGNGATTLLRGAGNAFATSGNRTLTARGLGYPAPLAASFGTSLPGSAAADPNRLTLPSDPACPTVVAVGDVQLNEGDEATSGRALATAQLAAGVHPDVVTVVGDATVTGRYATLSTLFESTWGMFRPRMAAIPGNHEYAVPDALGFARYLGPDAGTVGEYYYSWDIGAWHVVALDTGVPLGDGSDQLAWLEADLDAHPGQPIMAITHVPRFSGGTAGDDPSLTAMWRVLRAHGADLVISGHDHGYERFGPQDENGVATNQGIRQFVVGIGGAPLYSLSSYTRGHNLESWEFFDWGVLQLTLRPDSYAWRWMGISSTDWSDEGTAATHHTVAGGCS